MLIADGGGAVRPPVVVPKTVNTSTNNTNNNNTSAADAAAARARELQRQIEAMQARLREAQRKAEEARKRALEAQREAEKARKAEEAARKKADEAEQKKAEQARKLAEAKQKKEAAEARQRDKEVELLRAQIKQKKEEKADGKSSAETDKKVQTAQTHYDQAKRTNELSRLNLDYQEKQSKALAAEAKVKQLTPAPGRPSETISQDERDKLKAAQADAKTLRQQADDAKTRFTDAVGAEAGTEFVGDPGGPDNPAFANDPLHSPLEQLLKLAPAPGYSPLLLSATKPPSEQVNKTLNGIADGKTLDQIAKERGTSVQQLQREARDAGIHIDTRSGEDGHEITVERGGSKLVYTRDDQHDNTTVQASFADPQAPGGHKTVEAGLDGNGRYTHTTRDDKTGQTTTHLIDPNTGTRTDITTGVDGSRTETTTDLTGSPVRREVQPGEGYLDVAKAAGLTPEQLLALNPDVDYGKPLKPGQELVVSGVTTTTKTVNKDGTSLEKTVAADGTQQVVATTADGHRIVLMGEPDKADGPGEKIRKGLFEDGKSVADMAQSLGLTEDQVLAALPEGTVNVQKPGADNAGVRTRTIFDPKTNRTLVETYDARHDHHGRQLIDENQVFKVRQYNPDTGKYEIQDVKGGVGYAQKLADDKRQSVGELNQQIADLDQSIRYSKRMGEPTSDLAEQRRQLVAQRDAAQGQADVEQGRATATLIQRQQEQIDKIAANAYQRQFVARPGSKEQKEATKALHDILALADKVDRLGDAADKDVQFLQAQAERDQKHQAKVDADQALQTEFQNWKDNVWGWEGLPEERVKELKAQGQRPPGQAMYRNEEERNDAAWKAFVDRQKFLDQHGHEEYLRDDERAARNAWVQRNAASDAELKANDGYYSASQNKSQADAHVLQGDIDRLQAQKDVWVHEHPKDFSENFSLPTERGEPPKNQQELDRLNDQLAKTKAGGLQDGLDQKFNQYLQTQDVADREDPDKLKELSQQYQDDHGKQIEQTHQQINDLLMAGTRNRAQASEAYIAQWAKDNPELQKKLDGLRSMQVPDRQDEMRQQLLGSSHEGQQLKSALDMKYATQAQLIKLSDGDVQQLQKDLEEKEKHVDGQTWLRDMFSDTAEDARDYTKDQLDEAKRLQSDLANGKISLTEYTRKQDALMDAYGLKSIDVDKKLRDSDETWAVVDDAVRMTVAAAAGIGATLVAGPMAGIAVGIAVNQAWDTSNDIYAAANGRDIYADGHSSLLTLAGKATFGGGVTRDEVAFTLKDDAVDTASAVVSATGVTAGMRTSALLTARIAASKGVNLAAGETLNLGSRAVVGATAGTVGQGVDGAGRVGVETLHVGLDGKLGTQEGSDRIKGTAVSSLTGLLTAPVTGGISGAIPLNANKLFAPTLAAQWGNDAVGSLGTSELVSLFRDGRHMNKDEFIVASFQSVPGTLTNIALHPSWTGRAQVQHTRPSGAGFSPEGLPLQPTTLGRGRTWEDVANSAGRYLRYHEQASQPGSTLRPLKPSAGETAVLKWLQQDPAKRSGTRFVVSQLGPADTIYGSSGGVRARNRDTYKTFAEASAAARRMGGGWVNRVQPSTDHVPLVARTRVGADEIVGAVHVNGRGDVLPFGIPNTRHAPALVDARGKPGWFSPVKAAVRKVSGPTKALVGMSALQGGAITAKIFGSGWLFDKVTGSPEATWLNQTRGLGTRTAYFTGKRGLENALDMASRGETSNALRQVEIVANRRALRGLSPEEIRNKKQKALDQLKQFGNAAHQYLEGSRAAGVPDSVREKFPIKLASEAEIKADQKKPLKAMPDGELVAAAPKAQVLRVALGNRSATQGDLARAVDAYRAQSAAGGPLSGEAAAFAKLRPETREQLVAARKAELGYGTARDMVNAKGNLIDMKDVQGALGSTMHMGSRVGVSFKYGALVFATNSGLGGTYNFIKYLMSPQSGAKGVIKGLGLSGEVVGNVPNIAIQWSYLTGLLRRTKFSDAGPDSKVPIADVKAYLDKRIARMTFLRDRWWGDEGKWWKGQPGGLLTDGMKAKAKTAVEKHEDEVKAAQRDGKEAPELNRTLSKHVYQRQLNAAERVKNMEEALEAYKQTGDELKLREMAKKESELVAKSMNTAGDFMSVPSMFRYSMNALLATNPVLAGITVFHGIVSNGGWLRSQQGKGKIYGFNMATKGLYEGNGVLGVGKRIGRGYNLLLDKLPDSFGEKWAAGAKRIPVFGRFVKTDNMIESLKLEPSAEAAANRRRIRLLITGAITPTLNLVMALSKDDDKKKVADGPVTGGMPDLGAHAHPGDPSNPDWAHRITAAQLPHLEPVFVGVDGSDPRSGTLSGIAYDNLDALLAGPQGFHTRLEAGPEAEGNAALAQLFNLNPRFNRNLMDGDVSNVPGDPDTVLNGWQIQVGDRWAAA